jgi:hypothetical protein
MQKTFYFQYVPKHSEAGRFAQPGENSPRCPKKQGFWLSTGVEKPVDNPDPALDAVQSDILGK